MARASMTALIGRLRLLVSDVAGAGQAFTDDHLEVFLDSRRRQHRYAPLGAVETIAPGGAVTYLEHRAGLGWWEEGEQLVSGTYGVLTAATSDRFTGRWTFAADTRPPVLITGWTYDLHAAAADALEAWAAKVKLDFDFRADDQAFSRAQKAEMLLTQARTFRRRQLPASARLARSDQVPAC